MICLKLELIMSRNDYVMSKFVYKVKTFMMKVKNHKFSGVMNIARTK